MVRSITPLIPVVLAVAGCAVGPGHTAPQVKTPDAWPAPLQAGLTAEAAELREWWRGLKDPVLDSLVERALEGSLELREAAARVREARALRGITSADRLPAVDATASAASRHQSENSLGGFGGAPGDTSDSYLVGFDATWELDLFGRVRRSVEAADAELEASVESHRAARVMLIAEIARHYAEYRSAQARLAIAERNVKTQQDTLELSRDRLRAGLGTELQEAQALAQLETTRSRIPQLTIALQQSAFRLDVLLGAAPGTLAGELQSAAPVPPTPASVPVGLPAELLRRRPDIRRAERSLAAATARVGIATADLYPRFTLSGSFAFESTGTSNLFESDSHSWAVGPLAMRWPIFDGGRVRSAVRVQEARQEQALIAYERTVLGAHEEVANALVAYARLHDRRDSLAKAVQADQRAVELSSELWRRGLTDFLNVLDTQRALYLLQDQLAESDAALTTSLIALYKALGGGWDPGAKSDAAASDSQPAAPPAQ